MCSASWIFFCYNLLAWLEYIESSNSDITWQGIVFLFHFTSLWMLFSGIKLWFICVGGIYSEGNSKFRTINFWHWCFTAVLATIVDPFMLSSDYHCYFYVDAGGFGSYMLAMDQKTYELIGPDYPGNRAIDVMNPSLGWMIGFMFVVSFLGLFSLVALRKVFIYILESHIIHYVYLNRCSF